MQDPFDDIDCQTAFIEKYYDSFEEYCMERGIYKDYYCDHEFDYCESREDVFLDFAANYYDDQILENADNMNDLREEK